MGLVRNGSSPFKKRLLYRCRVRAVPDIVFAVVDKLPLIRYTLKKRGVDLDLGSNIKVLREITGLSQTKFAALFGIPPGTLRNWEQGIAVPPPYVEHMIELILRRDDMINIETIKFVKMLDDLAEKSNVGIEPFSTISSQLFDKVVCYDDRKQDEDGNYRIVLQACIDENHHDVVACYEDTSEYAIHVVCSRKDGDYVEVYMHDSKTYIVVENGRWYIA